MLASAVITEEEISRLFQDVSGEATRLGDGKGGLGTGVKSVDGAVGGGLMGGRVVGVWGEVGTGGAEVGLLFYAVFFWWVLG